MIYINKYYYERYALFSICDLLNYKIQDFEHKDRPDLQSAALDMGIEVVQAITEHDALTNRLIDLYFGKGYSGDEVVALVNKNNTKGKFKGAVYSINGIAAISNTIGLYDAEKHRNLVIEKIGEKSRLLENYKHYKTNGLYCFTHTGMLCEFEYPHMIDACRKSDFSFVFINNIDTILQWQAPSDHFIVHEIASEYLQKWKKQARNNGE